MKSKKYLIHLLLFSCFFSCQKTHFYVCDNPEKNCITFVTNAFNSYRYLYPGKVFNTKSEDIYAAVKLHKYDSYPDIIYVCYDEVSNMWEVVFDRDSIINNTLNPKYFQLSTSIEKDSMGIPTAKRYNNKNCSVISLYGREIEALNNTELRIFIKKNEN
jgi:hypothetical protein